MQSRLIILTLIFINNDFINKNICFYTLYPKIVEFRLLIVFFFLEKKNILKTRQVCSVSADWPYVSDDAIYQPAREYLVIKVIFIHIFYVEWRHLCTPFACISKYLKVMIYFRAKVMGYFLITSKFLSS